MKNNVKNKKYKIIALAIIALAALLCLSACAGSSKAPDAKGELEADSVLDLIESVKGYMEAIKDFEKVFNLKMPAAKPEKKIVKAKSADETINQFLKNMGW